MCTPFLTQLVLEETCILNTEVFPYLKYYRASHTGKPYRYVIVQMAAKSNNKNKQKTKNKKKNPFKNTNFFDIFDRVLRQE